MLNTLYNLKNDLKDSGLQGLALDIDETLSWTVGYWFERMQKLFGNPENLTIVEMEAKYKYSQNVPYWQSPEVHKWIVEQCFSNEIQTKIDVIPGAQEAVTKINEIVPIIAYITVRPDAVDEGTKKWLDRYDFPEAPILSRPRYVHKPQGNMWKADVLEYLHPHVLGIVDDNPGLVEDLPDSYEGRIFLYNSNKLPNKDDRAVACPDWGTVITEVEAEIRMK